MRKIAVIELGGVRGKKLARLYEQARGEALQELVAYKKNPLFVAGLMLYFGEGDKTTKHQVRLSNTDPILIKLYLAFLETVCGVEKEKIRIQLAIYPDTDQASNERFWSFATGVPMARFTKSILQKPRKGSRGGQGVCTVIVSSSYLKLKMLEWLALLPGELMKQ